MKPQQPRCRCASSRCRLHHPERRRARRQFGQLDIMPGEVSASPASPLSASPPSPSVARLHKTARLHQSGGEILSCWENILGFDDERDCAATAGARRAWCSSPP